LKILYQKVLVISYGDEKMWSKEKNAISRRRALLGETDYRKTRHNRYVEAARKARGLANLSTDPQTVLLAQKDANYFFKKAEETKP